MNELPMMKESIAKGFQDHWLKQRVLPQELKAPFDEHLTAINFRRMRLFAALLSLMALGLLGSDFMAWPKRADGLNPGYVLLHQTHWVMEIGMLGFFLMAQILERRVFKRYDLKRGWKLGWQKGYVLLGLIFLLGLATYTSGRVDQLLHQQITVYILAVFMLVGFIYLRPLISFLLLLCTYIFFVLLLVFFQPNLMVLRGHIGNGVVLTVMAWFFSANLYSLRVQDFLYQTKVEELVEQRTAMLGEINCRLEEEILARRRIDAEKIKDQEKIYRLASIVESTDDGIIGMTTEGVVLDWNQGAEQIYGYKAEEMIGQSIMKIILEDRVAELEEIFKRVLRGEKISHYETLRRHKDGRIVEVSLTVSPIKDNTGKVIGISTILRDVSEQKRLERELSRLDRLNLIGEMAASISHEVRNPMTTVRGFIQLLYNRVECANQRPYFDLIIEELDRANSILTEFLSISHTKMSVRKVQNLNAILGSILPLIEADAVGRNQSIHTELQDIPDLALDDKEIRQVILNLARNGLEAMAEGQVLRIRTYATPEEVVLEIQDEGRGIPAELLQKLGTPFLTTKENGTGLGLAVCYGIVTRHEGRIEIESSEAGSTFYVRFKR